jgi:hypothetical protein
MALHEPPCDDILTHVGRVYDEEVVGIPDLDNLSRVTLDDFRAEQLRVDPTYYAVLQREAPQRDGLDRGRRGRVALERGRAAGSVGPMNAAPVAVSKAIDPARVGLSKSRLDASAPAPASARASTPKPSATATAGGPRSRCPSG